MEHFILRYTGEGSTPAADLQRLRSLPGLRIVEESGRIVLLETGKQEFENLVSLFPGWVSSPIRADIELPDPRPMPTRPPRRPGGDGGPQRKTKSEEPG